VNEQNKTNTLKSCVFILYTVKYNVQLNDAKIEI